MNSEELLKLHKKMCDRSRALMAKKNHDYAGKSGLDPFANFEAVEKIGICSTETGILVRMVDKIMRLRTFVNDGELKVENESAIDSCDDMINYSIILAGYIQHKNIRVEQSKSSVVHLCGCGKDGTVQLRDGVYVCDSCIDSFLDRYQ